MATMKENLADVPGVGAYLSKHWQGRFSLGFAYWINGFVIGLLLIVPILLIEAYLLRSAGTVGIGTIRALIVFIIVYSVGTAVWQFVGIWRSADAHVSRGGKRVWAVLAQIAVVLGVARTAVEMGRAVPDLAAAFG